MSNHQNEVILERIIEDLEYIICNIKYVSDLESAAHDISSLKKLIGPTLELTENIIKWRNGRKTKIRKNMINVTFGIKYMKISEDSSSEFPCIVCRFCDEEDFNVVHIYRNIHDAQIALSTAERVLDIINFEVKER